MYKPEQLVGVPFLYGGRGPDSFDCYGLIMHIMREKHGIVIPDFRSSADQGVIMAKIAVGVQDWKKVEPAPETVVCFRIGGYLSHVGYMLNETQMIHTWEKSGGVVIERLDAWKQRNAGHYVYVGNH